MHPWLHSARVSSSFTNLQHTFGANLLQTHMATIAEGLPSISQHLIIWSGLCGILAILTTCIRILVRWSRTAFGIDDCSIIAALLAMVATYSISFRAATTGSGQHRNKLAEKEYQHILLLSWISQLLLYLSLCLLKLSIGLLILRTQESKNGRILAWCLVTGILLTSIEVIIVIIADCQPIQAHWTGTGICWSKKVRRISIYIHTAYGVLADLICCSMPTWMIIQLKITVKTKIVICGLLSINLM